MRYTTDDNRNSVKDGDGNWLIAPKKWYETTKTEHLEALREYWHKHLECYDTDGHWGELIFVFEDGKCFKMEYEAGWDDYGDLAQGWYHEELPLEKAPTWMHKYRDWL